MYATLPAQMPRRRSWLRRHKIISVAAFLVVVLAASGIARAVTAATTPSDYRNPATLASAVRSHEQDATGKHAVSAACGRIIGSTYTCSVAFSDLTEASYSVTVSADGSAYTVSD